MRVLRRMLAAAPWLLMILASAPAPGAAISKIGTDSVRLGYGNGYEVTGLLNWPKTIAWSQRSIAPCVSNWGAETTGVTAVQVWYPIPGTIQVKCVVTYQSVMGTTPPQPPPLTLDIEVPMFDPCPDPVGLDTDTAYEEFDRWPEAGNLNGTMGRYFLFRLTAGGFAVGNHISDTMCPQEKITNMIVQGGAPKNWDWGPTPPVNTDLRFKIAGDPIFLDGTRTILDFKFFALVPGPEPPPTGDLVTFTQEVRVVWKDWCGQVQEEHLGTWNFKRVGMTNGTWQLQLQ